MSDLYLGFDCSTQSLSAVVVAVSGGRACVEWQHSIGFDTALPAYGTVHGVLPSTDPAVAVAPPHMWAEALDLMWSALAASGLDLSRLRAISGSAQQHGSVYLAEDGSLSRDVSPIWMDSSTTEECREITEAVGGDHHRHAGVLVAVAVRVATGEAGGLDRRQSVEPHRHGSDRRRAGRGVARHQRHHLRLDACTTG